MISYKKRAEVAEALLEERNNDLWEILNEIISSSEELIKVNKEYIVASEEIGD